MSIPLTCKKCGDIIGAEDGMALITRGLSGDLSGQLDVNCPGRGKHPRRERKEHRRLFGWINDVCLSYPESCTSSNWSEYTGPRSLLCLCVALAFSRSSTGGLVVNGKWIWRHNIFGGDGQVALDAPREGDER